MVLFSLPGFFSSNVVPWFPLPLFQTEAPKLQRHLCVRDSFVDSCDPKKQSRDSVAAQRRRLDARAAQSPWPYTHITHTWGPHSHDAHIPIAFVLHRLCPQPVGKTSTPTASASRKRNPPQRGKKPFAKAMHWLTSRKNNKLSEWRFRATTRKSHIGSKKPASVSPHVLRQVSEKRQVPVHVVNLFLGHAHVPACPDGRALVTTSVTDLVVSL